MNEQIISPWVFYLLSVVDNMRCALFLAAFAMAILLVLGPAWTDGFSEYVTAFKMIFVAFFVSVVFLIFIPTSNVVIKMMIAQHITANNLEKSGNFTEQAVDKIIEKVVKAARELKGNKE